MPCSRRLDATFRSAARSLRIESLEERRVLSATPELLTDVGSTPHFADSNPFGFVEVGELTYFSTKPSSFDPQQTWVTDGTTNATRLLSEVLPGNLLVGGVVGNVAGTLYFTASDPSLTGYKLWKWGGFGSEPTPVLSAAGNPIAISTPMVDVDGVWYFGGLATNQGLGSELWRTDGTQAGTYQVKEIRPGPLGGFHLSNVGHQPTLFNVDGSLMFIANDGTHGSELWTSDGTEAGTVMVKDIRAGSDGGVIPSSFNGAMAAVVGEALYFSAITPSLGAELWRSDGTEAGTYQVKDIRLGNLGSEPQHLTNVGGILYFAANDGTSGNELWKSDGTGAGTVLVKNITWAGSGTVLFDFTEMNGVLYFGAADYLWRSDGTEVGTTQVLHDLPAPPAVRLSAPVGSLGQTYANLDHIVNQNGTLYFAGRDGVSSDFALWKFDGLTKATRVLSRSMAGIGYSYTFETVNFLTAAGDRLYFAGNSSSHGNEPWVSDGTTAGTVLLKDVTGAGSSSGVSFLTNVDGTLFFSARTGNYPGTVGAGWWTSDGSLAGTTSFSPIASVTNGYSVLGAAGGLLYYNAKGTTGSDWELWRTDGTASGTFRAKDIRPGTNGGLSAGFTRSIEMNGELYFVANDGVHGFELWRSDGTEAGTTMVADVFPGDRDGLSTFTMANVGGSLYFVANDGASGNSLWKTDGTAAGTSLVRSFNAWMPTNLFNVNGTLYFGAGHDDSGLELWKSDGTPAGTTLVKDIQPGNSLATPDPPGFANIGDTVYFIANDGSTGFELWKSDGTEAGTVLVKDVNASGDGIPGTAGSRRFAVVGSTLYFFANDGVHGTELWKSDGTEAGTALVSDIRPGFGSSQAGAFAQPINVGGVLYFGATNGSSDVELWRSDGTVAGTRMVVSMNGTPSSNLGLLTNVNGRLYFVDADRTHGTELWVLSPDEAAMQQGDYDQNGVTDGADFLKWQRAFGSADVTNDGDDDGTVDGGDLDVWRENFGEPASGAATAFASLNAEEEAAADDEVSAALTVSIVDEAAPRRDLTRDALFAAGDFSRLFAFERDAEVEGSLWRRGRAPLARRG